MAILVVSALRSTALGPNDNSTCKHADDCTTRTLLYVCKSMHCSGLDTADFITRGCSRVSVQRKKQAGFSTRLPHKSSFSKTYPFANHDSLPRALFFHVAPSDTIASSKSWSPADRHSPSPPNVPAALCRCFSSFVMMHSIDRCRLQVFVLVPATSFSGVICFLSVPLPTCCQVPPICKCLWLQSRSAWYPSPLAHR